MTLSQVNRKVIVESLNQYILERKKLIQSGTAGEFKAKLESEINRARTIIHMTKNL